MISLTTLTPTDSFKFCLPYEMRNNFIFSVCSQGMSDILGSVLYEWPPRASNNKEFTALIIYKDFISLPVQTSLENQFKSRESKRRFESNYIQQQRGKAFQWKWGLAKWRFHQLQKQKILLRGWRFHSWQMQRLQLRKKHKKQSKTLLCGLRSPVDI